MSVSEKVAALPKEPGVYIMRDADGTVIYVGKAKSLKNRVSGYFTPGEYKDDKVKAMISKVADFSYIVTKSELDALGLERNLIAKHQPYYNILLKDGKAFQYVRIDAHAQFPKLEVTRKLKKDGAKYFGPFFNGVRASEILKTLTYAYPVRACNTPINSKPKRECLNHHIGLCSAPCAHRISSEDYKKEVDKVINFLNGHSEEVEGILQEKMQIASNAEQFETALVLRDRLNMLKKLTDRAITYMPREIDVDAIGYASNGIMAAVAVFVVRGGRGIGCECFHIIDASLNLEECLSEFLVQYYTYSSRVPNNIVLPVEFDENAAVREWLANERGAGVRITKPERGDLKKLLQTAERNAEEFLERFIDKERAHRDFTLGAVEQLQKELNLKRAPHRIECFDISNISGTNKVASMAVFLGGEAARNHYRKFIIKTVEGSDDYASMREVISRRLNELSGSDMSFSTRPDLILIDGGKGQLGSALEAAGEIREIEFVSLAKREEEIFVPGRELPVKLPKHNYALRLLQRVRDEAHRFAITFHRSIRGKGVVSQLSLIDGIGEVKQKALLKRFKSLEKIKGATLEELAATNKISLIDAKRIYDYFR